VRRHGDGGHGRVRVLTGLLEELSPTCTKGRGRDPVVGSAHDSVTLWGEEAEGEDSIRGEEEGGWKRRSSLGCLTITCLYVALDNTTLLNEYNIVCQQHSLSTIHVVMYK
jgi:hypothetical protein